MENNGIIHGKALPPARYTHDTHDSHPPRNRGMGSVASSLPPYFFGAMGPSTFVRSRLKKGLSVLRISRVSLPSVAS